MTMMEKFKAWLASPERVILSFIITKLAAMLVAGLLLDNPLGFALALLATIFLIILYTEKW